MDAQCIKCGDREAEQRVDGRPTCTPCLIGALAVQPNAVFPYWTDTRWGEQRGRVLSPLGIENLPAAVDMADELFTLERMPCPAKRDMMAATHTRILSILGKCQYSERAYNDFVADVMKQVGETKAVRLQLWSAGRPYSPDFVALGVAAMYVAWLAKQEKRVQSHVERIDALLTFKIGAKRATAVQKRLYIPLGKFPDTTVELPALPTSIKGEVTREKFDSLVGAK